MRPMDSYLAVRNKRNKKQGSGKETKKAESRAQVKGCDTSHENSWMTPQQTSLWLGVVARQLNVLSNMLWENFRRISLRRGWKRRMFANGQRRNEKNKIDLIRETCHRSAARFSAEEKSRCRRSSERWHLRRVASVLLAMVWGYLICIRDF